MFDAEITEERLGVRNCQEKGREKFYVHLMYRLRRPDRWITIIPVAGVVKYRDHACLKPILGRTCTHFRVHTWPRCTYAVHSCAQCGKDASSAIGMCFLPAEFWNTKYVFVLSWGLPTRWVTALTRKRAEIDVALPVSKNFYFKRTDILYAIRSFCLHVVLSFLQLTK